MTPYRTSDEPEAEVLFRANAVRVRGAVAAILRRSDVREVCVERVGAVVRLVLSDAGPVLRAPFILEGASRITEGRHILMRLVVSDSSGARVSLGALSREEAREDGPPIDDWFDGARFPADEQAGEVMLENATSLWTLRAALLVST